MIITVKLFQQACLVIVQLSFDLPVKLNLRCIMYVICTLILTYNRLLFNTVCSQYWGFALIEPVKVLEKCTKNLIGHSRLAFNDHESNIDC